MTNASSLYRNYRNVRNFQLSGYGNSLVVDASGKNIRQFDAGDYGVHAIEALREARDNIASHEAFAARMAAEIV